MFGSWCPSSSVMASIVIRSFFVDVIVKLGAGVRMRNRYLNGFDVQFLGEIDALANGFPTLAGKADDEIAMNH